jgi:hypothetical protein
MPTIIGDVTIYDPAEWAEHIAHLSQYRTIHTASDFDYIFSNRPIPTASNNAVAFPAAFYALKAAALRGDVALVTKIYEEDWLPHTTYCADRRAV